MKKIVVAVDFSNGSIHALKYAINIANLVKCDILMVWVDKTATPESIYSSVGENYRGEVMKRFNDLVEKFQPTCTGGTLTFKLRKGKIYNEIVTYAKTKKADLIVTGSHGVSGFEEYWIGSNANRIVAHADCPVITVRNGFQIKDKDFKIVIPIDNSNHTLIKIPFTAKMAKIFDADVYIAVIFTTNLKTMHKRVENFVEKAKKYLEKEEVRYKIEHFETQNTTKTTIDFAKRIDADLIAIMTEQEDSREIGLLGPNAQQIVNHSPIPVLSMHISDADQTLKHINNSL
jgi:nucleotide-binding universal stress UspA family protein